MLRRNLFRMIAGAVVALAAGFKTKAAAKDYFGWGGKPKPKISETPFYNAPLGAPFKPDPWDVRLSLFREIEPYYDPAGSAHYNVGTVIYGTIHIGNRALPDRDILSSFVTGPTYVRLNGRWFQACDPMIAAECETKAAKHIRWSDMEPKS